MLSGVSNSLTRSDRRHVLILCPPNLVTKWEEELAHGSKLQDKISAWGRKLATTGHAAVARRICETLSTVVPIRRSEDVRVRQQRKRFEPPGGTYIVSQTLAIRKGRRLAALRRTEWDVVIVDEAHSAYARNALAKLEKNRRARTKILLTATPFQLEPRQWNGLARHLVKQHKKVMRHEDVAPYVDALSEVFASREAPDPPKQTVRAAAKVLRRLAARTVPRKSSRTYGVILLDGTEQPLPARLDSLDDDAVQALLRELQCYEGNQRDAEFEQAYFERRWELALKPDTFVAQALRYVVSQGTDKVSSPRLQALATWARRMFEQDIEALWAGHVQKTLVFTSLVGGRDGQVAERIRLMIASACTDAVAAARKRHGRAWRARVAQGREALRRESEHAAPEVAEGLEALARDELACIAAGKVGLRRQVVESMSSRFEGLHRLRLSQHPDETSFERKNRRRRMRTAGRSVAPWSGRTPLRMVERYTGAEDRKERDRAAAAFRELGPPWVLVASNVGSEGIDLHTYTKRIVHYDLEWNPARMEQREGRGDRLGRKLKGALEIFYCLVPRHLRRAHVPSTRGARPLAWRPPREAGGQARRRLHAGSDRRCFPPAEASPRPGTSMTRIASTWPLDGGYEWLRTSGAWSPAGTLDTEDPRGP
jgi:ERCC4-related helicase